MDPVVALLYGPLLFGGTVALMLSGVVAVQCIIFFKLYPDESGVKTAMVATVWMLDAAQSAFIIASLFYYFVEHFGHVVRQVIPWSMALTILVTVRSPLVKDPVEADGLSTWKAMQTCAVHLFYAQKIYRSSRKNWLLTGPIVCLASLRLLAAVVATAEMLHLGRWDSFHRPYPRLLFTAGLSLSAATDLLITLSLCYYLRKIRKLSSSSVMKSVLDTLTLYTLENGLVTLLTTVGSLVFFVVIPASGLSLALHFVIGKLYPNSLLLLLNTRKELREMHSGGKGSHVDPSQHLASYYADFPHRAPPSPHVNLLPVTMPPAQAYGYRPLFRMSPSRSTVEVKVERTDQRRDSVGTFETDLNVQRAYVSPPRSLGNTSLNWGALP
ncbi:Glycoside hydrolase [Mycena venus]|uniref:Glycoside hydrolase n=1 Tax=Mycena venus TaxID=2733690 RepID=A0A8H6XXA2_9AGAR|nr:Glycoside hydrolase [Mycena venus]